MIKKFGILLSVAALSACNATLPEVQAKKEEKPYVHIPEEYVSISCVTHGTGYIHSFFIEEPVYSGPVGGRMTGGTNCGGLLAAGYALPKTWYPGMKVRVRWKPNGREWVEKTTNIMRYKQADKVFVHFFPNDEVRVVSSVFYPESPKYPIPEDATVPPPEEQ